MHKKEFDLANLLNSIKKCEISINWEELQAIQLENIKKGNNHIGVSDLAIAQTRTQNKCNSVTPWQTFQSDG
ncbi:hypothetical protein [Candidatus Endomicrobiellum pyrsonymphae]|uniref:hypothetical protein n=1 Tax=Candidatus Endomicrobiellum pyrsonymphae TaxID=1408203 RepID=UPI0035A83FB4